jgi:hypothetical protein
MGEGQIKDSITLFSLKHYKSVIFAILTATLVLGSLISFIKVDTDPENMLDANEAVRIFHNQTKKDFSLYDMVVLGVVNEKNPNGVFNPDSLKKIYELTQFAKTLRWPGEKAGEYVGVVESDIIAPSVVDNISQGGPGVVKFEWLMSEPPTTEQQALEIKEKALSNPILKNTLVSADGKALCLYLPLTNKDLSYRVYNALRDKIAQLDGDEKYHITGLPVAEDTFGVEMFIQMAVSAPLAMLTIFILMLIFFRKLALVIPPMIVAMITVLMTMGLLIGSGFAVHIMSSMIPIFLMPISVVDSVHILSEFFDRYTKQKGRSETIKEVMRTLFTPMLYTSFTSAAGFASLALTPIPPVQVFGIFVAIGVMIAWACTVTFIPAAIMLIKEKSLESFGMAAQAERKKEDDTLLTRFLRSTGRFTYHYSRLIVVLFVIITVVSIYGISKISINDNPVKWFSNSHPIRQADTELNKHFGGTYMAYLVLQGPKEQKLTNDDVQQILKRFDEKTESMKQDFPAAEKVAAEAKQMVDAKAAAGGDAGDFLAEMGKYADEQSAKASPHESDVWYELNNFFSLEIEKLKAFKQPAVLEYVDRFQKYLQATGLVGKTTSVTDIVKKVHKELIDGREENYIVPDSTEKVAQCLLQYQSSHRPNDLWHLVTNDYNSANIWFQLRSGDNKDMTKVVKIVEEYFRENPPPVPLEHRWAGLTYINVIWQSRMVWGMLQSFLGSFLVVFIMMTILFRSVIWGLISMVPLTITILFIYGVIGFAGKDYDMPVAVLSALTLGMAVDFAIHFLERGRWAYSTTGNWKECAAEMFCEPARAITRNVLVIAIGFLPLLAAPLVPYKTVGIFMCAIMAASGLVTLFALPSLMNVFEKYLFRQVKEPMSAGCNCGLCLAISISMVLVIALNLHQYWHIGIKTLTYTGIVIVIISALVCGIVSRRKMCRMLNERGDKNDN